MSDVQLALRVSEVRFEDRAIFRWETGVPQPDVDALVLRLDHDGKREYGRRYESGQCYHVEARHISVWGVCLTRGVIADLGHHFSRNPDASTD